VAQIARDLADGLPLSFGTMMTGRTRLTRLFRRRCSLSVVVLATAAEPAHHL